MFDEHSVSGSLFNPLIFERTPQPTTPPPPRKKSKLQDNLIISHSLVHNKIMVHKNIDITLMTIFIKN